MFEIKNGLFLHHFYFTIVNQKLHSRFRDCYFVVPLNKSLGASRLNTRTLFCPKILSHSESSSKVSEKNPFNFKNKMI